MRGACSGRDGRGRGQVAGIGWSAAEAAASDRLEGGDRVARRRPTPGHVRRGCCASARRRRSRWPTWKRPPTAATVTIRNKQDRPAGGRRGPVPRRSHRRIRKGCQVTDAAYARAGPRPCPIPPPLTYPRTTRPMHMSHVHALTHRLPGLSLSPLCPSCVCAWCAAGWPGQQGSRWRQHVAGSPTRQGPPAPTPGHPAASRPAPRVGGTKSVGLPGAAEKI